MTQKISGKERLEEAKLMARNFKSNPAIKKASFKIYNSKKYQPRTNQSCPFFHAYS
jgi:hypothetical protein